MPEKGFLGEPVALADRVRNPAKPQSDERRRSLDLPHQSRGPQIARALRGDAFPEFACGVPLSARTGTAGIAPIVVYVGDLPWADHLGVVP
jgi:hypothetical protein